MEEGKKIAIIAGSIAGVILLSVGGFYGYQRLYADNAPKTVKSEDASNAHVTAEDPKV